jgi:hypothetical protein
MPFGRSDAGLECLSDYRASVVQRMRTFSRAQHVVSTLICSSGVGGDRDLKQGGLFAEQALQPAHVPYRDTGILPRHMVLPSLGEFPRLTEYWRHVIVAGRSRKSSAALVAVYHQRQGARHGRSPQAFNPRRHRYRKELILGGLPMSVVERRTDMPLNHAHLHQSRKFSAADWLICKPIDRRVRVSCCALLTFGFGQ